MNNEIDLKILKIIHTIVVSGSITDAANILKQSPGNISYHLGKMRELTRAHLFIRTREGMKPDATALELSLRYQQFINENQKTQGKKKRLAINTWSLLEMLFAASACGINNNKPEVCFIFNSYIGKPDERLSKLKNQVIDIDIGSKLPADNSISTVKLFTSGVSILVGKQFWPEDTCFDMQTFQSARHAVWSDCSEFYCENIEGAVEMAKLKASRDVAVMSASMINMVSLCANSRHIMMIPNFFIPMLENSFNVRCLAIPERFAARYDCYLHYHQQQGIDVLSLDVVQDAIKRITKQCSSLLL